MKIIYKLLQCAKGLFSKKSNVVIEVDVHKLLSLLNSSSHIEKINYKSEIEFIKLLKDISKNKFNSAYISQDLAKILNINNQSINIEGLINLLKREHNRKAIFNLLRINNEYITTKGGLGEFILRNIKQSSKAVEDLLSDTKASKLLLNNSNGKDFLRYAIRCEEDKIVKLLIKNGTPVDISILYYSIEYGKFEIFNSLTKIIKNKILISKEYNKLYDHAIKYKRCDIINVILCDIDINLKDNKNQTPLHHAVELGNFKIVELLISRGAELSRIDHSGCTPLNLAIKSRNVNITNLILDICAKCNCIYMNCSILTKEDIEFLWPLAESKGLVLKSGQNSKPSVDQLSTKSINNYPNTTMGDTNVSSHANTCTAIPSC